MKKEDLFRAVGDADDTLIEEFMSEKKRPPWARLGALAACVCLLAAGAFVWLSNAHAPLAQRTEEQPSQTGQPTTVLPSEQLQVGLTPLEALPQLSFAKGGGELSADIALPEGYFFRDLTDEALASVWGMETLTWEGYDPDALNLQTTLIYDGTGRVWCLALSGALGEDTFTLTLSPERILPTCLVYEGGTTCDFYGTDVTALRAGDYIEITFLRGEGERAVGARLEAHGASEAMEALLTRIVSQSLREDGVLQLDQLKVEDVPAWRSEQLTEQQARAEAGFGEYLPEALPAGFRFEAAYRDMGENRNWLSATWCKGYENLSITVDKCADLRGLVHADETEKYDTSAYGEKPDVPPELYDAWSDPTFYAEELTMEVIERRTGESDMGNVHGNFNVLFSDGTVVSVVYTCTRDDLAELLSFLLP